MNINLLLILLAKLNLENYFSGKFLALIFIVFVFLPNLTKAGDQNQADDQNQDVIYITGGTKVYGSSQMHIVQVTSDESVIKNLIAKKSNNSGITAQIESEKKTVENKIKSFAKRLQPIYFLDSVPAHLHFTKTKLETNADSVLQLQFYSKAIVSHQYTVLTVPVFIYLLKIYTADFSKTAELSHFLFSRPPPLFIAKNFLSSPNRGQI